MHFHDRLTWNIPAWSLSLEWYTYLIFPFIGTPLLRLRIRTNLGAAGVLFACLWGLAQTRQGSLDITYDFGFIRCLLEFSTGILIYRLFGEIHEKGLPYSGLLFVASLLAIPVVMQLSPSDAWLVPLFALLILTGAVNRGGIEHALNGSFLSFLGDVSYSVYMIHWLLLRWVFSAWRYFFKKPFGFSFDHAESLAALAALLCLTVLFAGLTQRWIEVPARRWIRKHWVSDRLPCSTPV